MLPDSPGCPPFAPLSSKRRLQGPPAKSKFLAVMAGSTGPQERGVPEDVVGEIGEGRNTGTVTSGQAVLQGQRGKGNQSVITPYASA